MINIEFVLKIWLKSTDLFAIYTHFELKVCIPEGKKYFLLPLSENKCPVSTAHGAARWSRNSLMLLVKSTTLIYLAHQKLDIYFRTEGIYFFQPRKKGPDIINIPINLILNIFILMTDF